jgi:hypothetical protein
MLHWPKRLGIAVKPQGAADLYINVLVPSRKRLIGEIKTTVPHSKVLNDLGGNKKSLSAMISIITWTTLLQIKDLLIKTTFDVMKRKVLKRNSSCWDNFALPVFAKPSRFIEGEHEAQIRTHRIIRK